MQVNKIKEIKQRLVEVLWKVLSNATVLEWKDLTFVFFCFTRDTIQVRWENKLFLIA